MIRPQRGDVSGYNATISGWLLQMQGTLSTSCPPIPQTSTPSRKNGSISNPSEKSSSAQSPTSSKLNRFIRRRLYHSAAEIAAIDAVTAGRPLPLHLAARWGLESLRHIPDSDDPAAKQTQDRKDLLEALQALEIHLRAFITAETRGSKQP